jgi:hypothetical protein
MIDAPGGILDMVNKIKDLAAQHGFPVIAILPRRKLGYVCLKKAPVSGVAVLNYGGAEDIFKPLVTAYEAAREELAVKLAKAEGLIKVNDGSSGSKVSDERGANGQLGSENQSGEEGVDCNKQNFVKPPELDPGDRLLEKIKQEIRSLSEPWAP